MLGVCNLTDIPYTCHNIPQKKTVGGTEINPMESTMSSFVFVEDDSEPLEFPGLWRALDEYREAREALRLTRLEFDFSYRLPREQIEV